MGMDMLKGLATTLRELGKKPTTVSYPEEKRELPARYRGRHVLHRYENGLERCVGCFLCAGACPADAIYIEAATSRTKSVVLAQHAIRSESDRAIKAMLSIAQKMEPIVVDAVKLDANPRLFNCLNGTLDLTTCKLREHRREDLITRLAEVEYNEGAKSELWEKFLERTLPDEALLSYVQKSVGVTLYGRHGMKVVFVIHGASNTGKGTFQTATAAAIGEYAMTAEIDVLRGAGKNEAGDAPRPGIVRLKPARMVNIYETTSNLRINAGLLKTLSGDDEITARGLHQAPITFLPQFTIWLATNYRPHVPHDDDAAWGRLREVPFPVEIPKNERDPKVREALREGREHRAAALPRPGRTNAPAIDRRPRQGRRSFGCRQRRESAGRVRDTYARAEGR
jgi:P4 family phage/plasmid primase-like protien